MAGEFLRGYGRADAPESGRAGARKLCNVADQISGAGKPHRRSMGDGGGTPKRDTWECFRDDRLDAPRVRSLTRAHS